MTKQLDSIEIIRRIIITPLGSTVMRPWFGSLLFELIDKTVNDEWVLDATRYTHEAIERYEANKENYPSMASAVELVVEKVLVQTGEVVSIHIEYKENGQTRTLDLGFGEVVDATV